MSERYAIDAALPADNTGSNNDGKSHGMKYNIGTLDEDQGRISMSRLSRLSRLFQASPKMQLVEGNELDRRKIQKMKTPKEKISVADVPRYCT